MSDNPLNTLMPTLPENVHLELSPEIIEVIERATVGLVKRRNILITDSNLRTCAQLFEHLLLEEVNEAQELKMKGLKGRLESRFEERERFVNSALNKIQRLRRDSKGNQTFATMLGITRKTTRETIEELQNHISNPTLAKTRDLVRTVEIRKILIPDLAKLILDKIPSTQNLSSVLDRDDYASQSKIIRGFIASYFILYANTEENIIEEDEVLLPIYIPLPYITILSNVLNTEQAVIDFRQKIVPVLVESLQIEEYNKQDVLNLFNNYFNQIGVACINWNKSPAKAKEGVNGLKRYLDTLYDIFDILPVGDLNLGFDVVFDPSEYEFAQKNNRAHIWMEPARLGDKFFPSIAGLRKSLAILRAAPRSAEIEKKMLIIKDALRYWVDFNRKSANIPYTLELMDKEILRIGEQLVQLEESGENAVVSRVQYGRAQSVAFKLEQAKKHIDLNQQLAKLKIDEGRIERQHIIFYTQQQGVVVGTNINRIVNLLQRDLDKYNFPSFLDLVKMHNEFAKLRFDTITDLDEVDRAINLLSNWWEQLHSRNRKVPDDLQGIIQGNQVSEKVADILKSYKTLKVNVSSGLRSLLDSVVAGNLSYANRMLLANTIDSKVKLLNKIRDNAQKFDNLSWKKRLLEDVLANVDADNSLDLFTQATGIQDPIEFIRRDLSLKCVDPEFVENLKDSSGINIEWLDETIKSLDRSLDVIHQFDVARTIRNVLGNSLLIPDNPQQAVEEFSYLISLIDDAYPNLKRVPHLLDIALQASEMDLDIDWQSIAGMNFPDFIEGLNTRLKVIRSYLKIEDYESFLKKHEERKKQSRSFITKQRLLHQLHRLKSSRLTEEQLQELLQKKLLDSMDRLGLVLNLQELGLEE